jgi:hypothetical protein
MPVPPSSPPGALPNFLAYRNVKQLRPVPDVNLSGNSFTSLTCQEYEYADAVCTDSRPPVPTRARPPQSCWGRAGSEAELPSAALTAAEAWAGGGGGGGRVCA